MWRPSSDGILPVWEYLRHPVQLVRTARGLFSPQAVRNSFAQQAFVVDGLRCFQKLSGYSGLGVLELVSPCNKSEEVSGSK